MILMWLVPADVEPIPEKIGDIHAETKSRVVVNM